MLPHDGSRPRGNARPFLPFGLGLALLLALVSTGSAERIEGRVLKVYDGDTIFVALPGGRTEKVRLLWIDAPETGKNGAPDEVGARASTERLASLVNGRRVLILTEGDAGALPPGKDSYGQGDHDRHGRLLGLIYPLEGQGRAPGKGESVNERLVAEGLAVFYWHGGVPPGLESRLLDVQVRAMAARSGNWEKALEAVGKNQKFIGNSKSRRFFSVDCNGWNKVHAWNRRSFGSLTEAYQAGFAPARHCGVWPLDR